MKCRYKYVTCVVLLAFLLNLALPFLAVYNVKAEHSYAKQMSEMFGEKVLICTATGFKWVTWQDLQNGKEDQTPHPDYKCALCYLAAHGLKYVTAPNTIAVGYGFLQGNTGVLPYSYHPPAFHRQSSLHTRAPPHSIIG
jgi:hypothetical protein